MKGKKYSIRVCEKGERWREPGRLIKTISRVIWGEQIGNFNPIFCRYNGKRCLVQSEAGDTSDPFRRTEEYKNTFFIEVDK